MAISWNSQPRWDSSLAYHLTHETIQLSLARSVVGKINRTWCNRSPRQNIRFKWNIVNSRSHISCRVTFHFVSWGLKTWKRCEHLTGIWTRFWSNNIMTSYSLRNVVVLHESSSQIFSTDHDANYWDIALHAAKYSKRFYFQFMGMCIIEVWSFFDGDSHKIHVQLLLL